MRIAYVSADPGVSLTGHSGSAIHLRELAVSLAARGHHVTVFTAGAQDAEGTERLPFEVVPLDGDPLLAALRERLTRRIRQQNREPVIAGEIHAINLNQSLLAHLTARAGQFDLVYERQALWSWAGLQFARRERIPYLLELNAPLVDQQSAYRELALDDVARAVEGMLLSSADRLLVTCSGLIDYAQAHGASRRAIRVLPCGVSANAFQQARARVADEFVLGFVGSLKPWHGIQPLMESFLRLSEIWPGYRLKVIGTGPLLPYIQLFSQEHGLTDRVELIGEVDHREVPRLLSQCDAGLAPYPPLDPFYFSPLKVWEYAAAGVPIIASDAGDLARLFPHKEAALLHPPGKVGKIVKHIELLRASPELGERLARRARRVARAHTWDRLAARLEGVVRGAAGGATGRTRRGALR